MPGMIPSKLARAKLSEKRRMATLRRGKRPQLARSFCQVGGSARRIIGGMVRRSRQSTPVRLPTNFLGVLSIISDAL
jgi:hypothetical protein